MKPEADKRREKTVGYMLIAVGLALIILPAIVALYYILSQHIPQLVPLTEETDFIRGLAIFSNVCMIFFTFVIILWAGSIISSRGVAMVKDVKLKLVRKSLEEAVQTENKTKGSN